MKTLKISWPIGQTLFQALLYLLILCAGLEFLSRTPFVDGLLLPESYGTSHPHFETQLTRLKARAAQGEQIDCIFLGNSQVLFGVDPAEVEQGYFESTGRTIHCQNFGLGGLPPMTTEPLARLLIKNFHPSVIIFGTGLWDYSASNAQSINASIMSSPWVKYQLGTFSIDGWFYENSQAYRYIFGMDRYLKSKKENDARIEEDGHAAYSGQTDLTVYEQLEYFETIARRPDITPIQRDGLRSLVALNSNEVRIIVFEMPSNPTFYSVKRKARTLYPEFERMLVVQTSLAGVDLWMTQNTLTIPPEDWYDLLHLNDHGSVYFSRLLGNYLASINPSPFKVKQP
jgi:hypothetical protein